MKARRYFRDILEWGSQKRHSEKETVDLNVLIDEGGEWEKNIFKGERAWIVVQWQRDPVSFEELKESHCG